MIVTHLSAILDQARPNYAWVDVNEQIWLMGSIVTPEVLAEAYNQRTGEHWTVVEQFSARCAELENALRDALDTLNAKGTE